MRFMYINDYDAATTNQRLAVDSDGEMVPGAVNQRDGAR
jgi:hypothetical protein